MGESRKIRYFSENQTETVKSEYAELRKTTKARKSMLILAKRYECSESTIFKYIRDTENVKKYNRTIKIGTRTPNQAERIETLARRNARANKTFNAINVGDTLNLIYRETPRIDKSSKSDIRINTGEVIMKTPYLFYIKDLAGQKSIQDISPSQLLTGHVRVEVASC